MINDLNRIKRILSARLGTEIPKFLGGYKIYHNSTGIPLYSPDGQTWYNDENHSTPFNGNLNDYTEPELEKRLYLKNTSLQRRELVPVTTLQPRSLNDVIPQNNESNITYRDVTTAHSKAMKYSADLQLTGEDKKLYDQMQQETAQKGQAFMAGMNAISAVGGAIGAAQQAIDSDLTKGISAGYDGVANAVSGLGPYGLVIGGAMKALGALGDMSQAMGGGTDQMSKLDSWMDSPLLSWNIGMLNGFAGKNSNAFGADQDILAKAGSSYGGTTSTIMDAAESADKKYGLFSWKSRKKANEAIAKAQSQLNLMGDIANNATDLRLAVQSMGEQAGLAYSMMTDGGYNLKYTYAAKQGGILEWEPDVKLEWEPLVELNWELPKFKEGGNIDITEELEWIPEFKSGGKTEKFDIPEIEETNLKNVIPEGALHKNKHHMEHAEGLTKKGIPVIDENGEQQAEIECEEWTMTLELTKAIEDLYNLFYSEHKTKREKENAALTAGKILVDLILYNTDDRAGLLDKIKI